MSKNNKPRLKEGEDFRKLVGAAQDKADKDRYSGPGGAERRRQDTIERVRANVKAKEDARLDSSGAIGMEKRRQETIARVRAKLAGNPDVKKADDMAAGMGDDPKIKAMRDALKKHDESYVGRATRSLVAKLINEGTWK